jgi:hypothetical protein
MSEFTTTKEDTGSKESDKPSDRKQEPSKQENLVLDTAGGEMPDPKKMPSETTFHSGAKKDI